MPVTFNCTQVGQKALWNQSAFEGRAVRLDNPYKQLANADFLAIQTFRTKKEATEFCQRWGITQTGITEVHSRFQRGWAIGLGRFYFAPEHAEGLLFAHSMGCKVDSIDDETKWQH